METNKKLIQALVNLIDAIESSEHGWNGIDAFPEDYYSLLDQVLP